MLLEVSEWLIMIVIVIVLIFGAGKIPDLAKSLGRAQGEFEKGKVESQLEVQRLKEGQPSPQMSERDKLLKAAHELGVPTKGGSDDQIRQDVKRVLA